MTREQLIAQIHASSGRVVLVVTGGGSQAIADLLAVPGASETVLEAVVPYSMASLEAYSGGSFDRACSAKASRVLAMAALERARRLSVADSTNDLLGVSCTAALATNREKRGPHRAFVGVQSESYTLTATVDLDDRSRDRRAEERVVADVILNQIASACGVNQPLDIALDAAQLSTEQIHAKPEWRQLLLAERDRVLVGAAPDTTAARPRLIFPGSFDPRHNGHAQMARFAADKFAAAVEFELSLQNVDKPMLDYCSVANRVAQFGAGETVWLTRAATFVRKATLFPNVTFIVGADTILRLADARYYGDDAEACRQAIRQIANQACRFLVFGRVLSGNFVTLAHLDLPAELREICDEVDQEAFRCDISSSEIRQGNL